MARFPCQTFSEEVLQKYDQPKDSLPIRLTSDDSMFSDMRDLNFSAVGHYLSSSAKSISAAYAVSLALLCWVRPFR